MPVYHRTHHAEAIRRDGFHDGSYVLPSIGELRGVFVSADWPVDENEGADGDRVLALGIPEALFVEFEWVEDAKTWREAMIPSERLSAYSETARLLSEDALTIARWDSFRVPE